MSRMEKFGRGNNNPPSKKFNEEAAASSEVMLDQAEDGLPARRHIHPSNKMQVAKWYYRLLIVLFISLLIGLLVWGRQYA